MKIIRLRDLLNKSPVFLLAGFFVCLMNIAPGAEASRQKVSEDLKEEQNQDCFKGSEDRVIYKYRPDSVHGPGTEKKISDISKRAAGKVYYKLKDEGDRHEAAKVAVVAAVPLSDLKRETEFGRLMAEYLLTDLADRGIKVTELRLGNEISIMAQTGEFILSRNIGELAEISRKLDYVVVSTFSNTRKKIIVQGRLVNLHNGTIVSSWRDTLSMNRELLSLFHDAPEPHTIAIKGME